jgi:hypothetical protein
MNMFYALFGISTLILIMFIVPYFLRKETDDINHSRFLSDSLPLFSYSLFRDDLFHYNVSNQYK